MIKPLPFANALALVAGLGFLLFYTLGGLAPAALVFVYNAQFLGANVARFIPQEMSFWFFLGNIIVAMGTSWLAAYAWAWLYNTLAGK